MLKVRCGDEEFEEHVEVDTALGGRIAGERCVSSGSVPRYVRRASSADSENDSRSTFQKGKGYGRTMVVTKGKKRTWSTWNSLTNVRTSSSDTLAVGQRPDQARTRRAVCAQSQIVQPRHRLRQAFGASTSSAKGGPDCLVEVMVIMAGW